MPNVKVDMFHSYSEDMLRMIVPQSIRGYADDLGEFLARMLLKLDKNSHKNTPARHDMKRIVELLRDEIIEFEEQMVLDKLDENAGLELADIANFAFIAFIAWRAGNSGTDAMAGHKSDLPEFISVHVPDSMRMSTIVELPPHHSERVRYMYTRADSSGKIWRFGPYDRLENAVTYGERAFNLRAGASDV